MGNGKVFVWLVSAACAAGAHASGDALRGAALYLQLPGAQASCVNCHGPDPAANRNNLLRAANQPAALQKALNTVSAMGFLRDAFDDTRIEDVSAYLSHVLLTAAADAPLAVWPRSIEFGSLGLGEASALHTVKLQNRRPTPIALASPAVLGLSVDVSHDCPSSLLPGATCSIALRASATEFARAAGALQLFSDAHSQALLVPLSYAVGSVPTGRLSLAVAQQRGQPGHGEPVRSFNRSRGPRGAAPAPDAAASPAVGGSWGGSIGVGFVALLALAALALVIDRSRQRHAHVTRAS